MSMKQTDKHNCCFNNKNFILISCLFRQSFEESCRKLNKSYCIGSQKETVIMKTQTLWNYGEAQLHLAAITIADLLQSHFNDLSPIMGGSSKSNLRFIIMICSENQPLRRNLYTQYDKWNSSHAINKGFQVQRYEPKQILIRKNERGKTIWQILIKIIK